MLLKRRAFSFIGTINSNCSVNYSNSHINISSIVGAIEDTCDLLDVGGKFIRYCCEKQKTKEIYKQVEYMRKMLDIKVEEERLRSEIEISEAYKRAELEIIKVKTELKNELEALRNSISLAQQKHINDNEINKRKIETQEKIRKLIVERLSQIGKWIDNFNETQEKSKIFYELEEQFRITSEQYSKLVEKII